MPAKSIVRGRDSTGYFPIPVYGFFLIIFFCLILSGCSPTKLRKIELKENTQPGTNDLKLGESAFFQKNYRAAGMIFTTMIDNEMDPEIIEAALYNLACTRLAESETEQEIDDAMALLKNLPLPRQTGKQRKNPLLLIPGIEKIIEIKEKNQREILKKEELMAGIVNDQEKTIVRLKQVIKTLKHQISELENIDQEIQEKRKNN